jgi:hypothetical protein
MLHSMPVDAATMPDAVHAYPVKLSLLNSIIMLAGEHVCLATGKQHWCALWHYAPAMTFEWVLRIRYYLATGLPGGSALHLISCIPGETILRGTIPG